MFIPRGSIDPVTYGWYQDQFGWHFVVDIPNWLSPAERNGMLGWLQDYAATIRRERPLWAVRIHPTQSGFLLDAFPGRDQIEFAENLFRLVQENTYA